MPAHGRQLKAALDAGLRPATGGGSIIVTSDWNYARAFDPGRAACPPDDSADEYDFAFLNGCEVVVLVPGRDEGHGRRLLTRIRDAGADELHARKQSYQGVRLAVANGYTMTEDAVDLLRDMLVGGRIFARDIKRGAGDAGISDKALRSARQKLGIAVSREGFNRLRAECARGPGTKRHVGRNTRVGSPRRAAAAWRMLLYGLLTALAWTSAAAPHAMA